MTKLLHFTTHLRKIPPSTSLHFATLERRSRVLRLSSRFKFTLCGRQYPKCERAIRGLKFAPHTTTHINIKRNQIWRFKQLHQNQTHVHMNTFSNSHFLLDHPVYYVKDTRTHFCIFTVTDTVSLTLLAFMYYYTILTYLHIGYMFILLYLFHVEETHFRK
jgi:hypothetical protein